MERRRSTRRPNRRYRRPWLKKCKEYIRTFIAFMFSNVGIIGLVIGYTIAGAFIFQFLESGKFIEVHYNAIKNRTLYAQKLWNISMKLNRGVDLREKDFREAVTVELLAFQENFVNLTRKGFDGTDDTDGKKSWSFAGAFLFSLTVITTIGYGNIWPHTPNGKIASIIYAIIGMPLFLLYLSNIGDVMARSFKWIYANLCLCRWCPGVAKRRAERRMRRDQKMMNADYDSESKSDKSSSSNSVDINMELDVLNRRESVISDVLTNYTEGSYDVENVTVPITVCLMIMVGYICGGAILFCQWEQDSGWSFLDASYFCFISLSTIGFGDFVPGDKIFGGGKIEEILELKFVFCSMYLMLGMALIAMCFNLMQEEVIHKIRSTIRTVKYIFRCR
ncbi:potassium channel subfamily K member 15 [Anthonomus grandis grandis]|uniref:potassium channel subfamily K member 15 n=1 Tax=Anthonomus grandis grandis TaxID=2921223 RepID=UPI002166053D|nr:potassium channel subfamily K member 15 [Anthonomus grandis grandis]XP_050300150.1 potassium channel subfamily K member 15 [Anthonomus grandis grandis]XP_050300151.1 potassium channel subfamily K member 15 [Anthonomus grandis grandis]